MVLGEVTLALGRLPMATLNALRADAQRAARGQQGVGGVGVYGCDEETWPVKGLKPLGILPSLFHRTPA
eukprot:12232854-Karenia_brevis.AAC.1